MNPIGACYPFLSVVIPVYNGESTLRLCLDSLVHQSYPRNRYEVIVVDNGSTDSTADLAAQYSITYLFYHQKKGPSAARNRGVDRARGDLVLFTDADCVAPPDLLLNHALAHLEWGMKHPGLVAVGGGIQGLNANLWALCDDLCSWFYFDRRLPRRWEQQFAPTANLSVHTSAVRALRGFNEAMLHGEDVDFGRRLIQQAGSILFLPSAVITHINRTTYADFRKHRLAWARGHYFHLAMQTQTPSRHTVGTQVIKLCRSVGLIVLNSMRMGKLSIIWLWPLILWGQSIDYAARTRAELDYRRLSSDQRQSLWRETK